MVGAPPCSPAVSSGDAASLGLDLEPVEAALRRLRSKVDAKRLPGVLCSLVRAEPGRPGRLLHYEAYGCADLQTQAPLAKDTLFRLYSQTKPITVVGFMILRERGLVQLEDPVSRYIPSFARLVVEENGKRRAPVREVTMHDLLAHTSGIGFGPGFGYKPENDYEEVYYDLVQRVDRGELASLEEWCECLARLPLSFQPGADWGYGYSSDVLGRVIEVIAGRPLDAFLHDEVLAPLGMKDTFFEVPMDRRARLATLYKREPWDGSGKVVKHLVLDQGGSSGAPSAFLEGGSSASRIIQGGGCVGGIAGGLVSTMEDWMRFGQMLLNGGEFNGIRLLAAESVELLKRDWLNDFMAEKREVPVWVWGHPGIGFSPLGQLGVESPEASRRIVGSQLHTVHWGGAGGSGYMLNWSHRLLQLSYTGCTYDTVTQKVMWRAVCGVIRRRGAKAAAQPEQVSALPSPRRRLSSKTPSMEALRPGETTPKGKRSGGPPGSSTPHPKRRRQASRKGGEK